MHNPNFSQIKFAGHNTFPLRHTWLPKAISITRQDPRLLYNEDDAMINLGVGRNMVGAVRHWAESTQLLVNNVQKRLYELNHEGQIISWRDLKLWNYTNTDGLLFAPSGDQTDDPSINNLYIVDSGGFYIQTRLGGKWRARTRHATVTLNGSD